MLLRNWIFLAVFFGSLLAFAYSVLRLMRGLRIGTAENRFDHPWQRLKKVLVVAMGQSKILREPVAGILHALIFWGFVILLTAILEAIAEGLLPGFSLEFLGPVRAPLAFLQDLVAGLVMVAVIGALVRRYITRPARLQVEGRSQLDATLILVAIFLIMVTMLGQFATRMVMEQHDLGGARFLSATLVPLFLAADYGTVVTWYGVFWWSHIVLVLAFLNYLPYSKHLHVLTSLPNVYFSSLQPRGALKPLNLEAENVEKFGASDVTDLTWKQLLDGYTCTECGRCTASCPANLTGKVLSPRKIIMDVRKRLHEKQFPAAVQALGAEGGGTERLLLEGFVTPQELWACTTCMACVQECPVNIEHVDVIVEMRRNLVLMESRFPPEVQTVFRNLENNFTPWAFSSSTRADWAEGLDVPRMADSPDAEILFWVGCAGSYDARYKSVSRALVRLMQKAGVRFAILGSEEKCSGDSPRRMGNEYLAQILMKDNVATLNRYGVKRIVTACPHCFNTLKNEYPQFGGSYEVLHHSSFLRSLLRDGRIKAGESADATVTYHDSCYLGRYNSLYDAPRSTLQAVPGLRLVEMRRSRSRGLCCGAGGGRMWMEEHEGKRINVERTEEALSTHPDVIGTACPFCMTMMNDGVKAKEAGDQVQVKDIAEILLDAVEEEPKAS